MKHGSVHQLLHGYRQGHQLLAGSLNLEPRNADLVARLSDLSGLMSSDTEVRPYLTAYPLPTGDYYALAKTWLDDNAPRAGCVLTHTLLIPVEEWGKSSDPHIFARLFILPGNTEDIALYRVALTYEGHQSQVTISRPQLRPKLAVEFVATYFGEGVRPLVWFGEQHPENIFWQILSGIWPALRAQFACCTLSLQPRALDERPFDLLFAPAGIYSRFHKIPRENILDTSSPTAFRDGKGDEPWYQDYAAMLFDDSYPNSAIANELTEFGPLLGTDPTEVRRLFLIRELQKRVMDTSTAGAGWMDLVEVVAPKGEQSRSYKAGVVRQSLKAAALISDPGEALKCYFLISERLGGTAFSQTNGHLASQLSSAVAVLAGKYPETALGIGERLFGPHARISDSAFARGIIAGLAELTSTNLKQLTILRHFPTVAPSIIVYDPRIAVGFWQGVKTYQLDPAAESDLIMWIASLTDPEAHNHIRNMLLPEIDSDDAVLLIEQLLIHLAEKDVGSILETLSKSTTGFSLNKIRRVICERVSRTYPRRVREWARQVKAWSSGTAIVVAASYAADESGLQELCRDSLNDALRDAQVMSSFLQMIAVGQLPLWFREHAQRSPDFLVPLLALGSHTPPDVSNTLQMILSEVREVPIAKEAALITKVPDLRDFQFWGTVIDQAMRSAIREFIAGDLDWQACQSWHTKEWAIAWLERVTRGDLEAIITSKVRDDPKSWGRAWEWLAQAPDVLYQRSPSVLPKLIEGLISARRRNWNWDATFTEEWISIIRRASDQTDGSMYLQLCADALHFAFQHVQYPLGSLVAESFLTVYIAVVESPTTPPETLNLFGDFDWDKGKELRKDLVASFLRSAWHPGDLAIAAREKTLLRKVVKRTMRQWKGNQYVEAVLKDLAGRVDPLAVKVRTDLAELAESPDFYEPWD